MRRGAQWEHGSRAVVIFGLDPESQLLCGDDGRAGTQDPVTLTHTVTRVTETCDHMHEVYGVSLGKEITN